jgi:hypothetical protein
MIALNRLSPEANEIPLISSGVSPTHVRCGVVV